MSVYRITVEPWRPEELPTVDTPVVIEASQTLFVLVDDPHRFREQMLAWVRSQYRLGISVASEQPHAWTMMIRCDQRTTVEQVLPHIQEACATYSGSRPAKENTE